MKRHDQPLTDARLKAELERCEYCEEKPCREACPVRCSPADFIMAARVGEASDYRRAAELILEANPLGGVCGAVCPDSFCMKACSRRTFDRPIEIPAVQAAIIQKARAAGLKPLFPSPSNGKKVAVIGAGPAGLAAASVLARRGYRVTVFESHRRPGGMLNLIPGFRLSRAVIRSDIDFIRKSGSVKFRTACRIDDPARLLKRGGQGKPPDARSRRTGTYDAVVVGAGLDEPARIGIPGEAYAVTWQRFLSSPARIPVRDRRIAVLGGGAVAVDCAVSAKRRGALSVEIVYRRRQEDMPLTGYERGLLQEHGIEITSCAKPLAIVKRAGKVRGLRLARMQLPKGKPPWRENFVESGEEGPVFRRFDIVISAIGGRSSLEAEEGRPGVFYAGDMVPETGPRTDLGLSKGTVVGAVASGKNAALEADRYLTAGTRAEGGSAPAVLDGAGHLPVPIEAEFFGRRILSPFLLSAAPHTDGYAQMREAYEHGWPGGVMKTAFESQPIHIPGEYMFVLGSSTYGNCDNVSGHPLDRVCGEVERLVRQFPERLTLASTGGPVTGRDDQDRAAWQSNTRKLEGAGAMGIEYSLSCPQGGDGTAGDVVSQNAELTARVIGWVMESGDGRIPKLFKLTGAVTAIRPILSKVGEVLGRYPGKKAGVTLANSFPSLAFRPAGNRRREEGVVIGLSGEGILPISNLTLARAAGMGIAISGNGGAMDYRAAARFLSLGAGTVQFCTIVMKYGLGIVDELHSGLSHLMADRGFRSVSELVGSALPDPITGFDSLSSVKKLPEVAAELCQSCGNCSRCPYQAITLGRTGVPSFNASLCIGCSLCAQKCFAGAIFMRERSPSEAAMLRDA
jgi:NADPH-dependent glutamate synthase beta subunit-like oxidoreductase/dihydroorotate dehydrogenase/Pyruvate/2-oxoacid:ferredoxin oxidoreductase delta subunit